ncbi:hypothetical protein [Legionella parisiensis]|uniref:Uncharacterized protein n=1 Tax=Legionella parisiensis TaxID=45071 RepID=A0A1E5JV88_9GAMM|nr:hypothetical protein [Legionella parisiensis]KTD40507.1 hypothetical protein Lpar_1824 [Legionella parisiensis]OEH48437.1 hypothetical protein lpari_00512 [Legionella parisiensis]STX77058.1 Uncharacterised protein [Legionella parisiensis]
MSRFPNTTSNELRRYFNSQSLENLLKINISYGPHFESLDARIDEFKMNLGKANSRLAYFTEKHTAHLLTYKEIEIREVSYQSIRNSMLSETDQTDRLLGLKAIGISPMETYEYEERCLAEAISKTSDEIERMNRFITDLEEKVKIAFSELRILNSVIQAKRQLISEPPSKQLGSQY